MDEQELLSVLILHLGKEKEDQIKDALKTMEDIENRRGMTLEETQALEKALSLATTVEECAAIFGNASPGSDVKNKFLDKIDVLLSKRITLATTVKDCMDISSDILSRKKVKNQ